MIANCPVDKVMIDNVTLLCYSRNGGLENSPLIGKFCGSNAPPRIIPSFANALYLKFSTDISMSYRGFNIEWDGTSTGESRLFIQLFGICKRFK